MKYQNVYYLFPEYIQIRVKDISTLFQKNVESNAVITFIFVFLEIGISGKIKTNSWRSFFKHILTMFAYSYSSSLLIPIVFGRVKLEVFLTMIQKSTSNLVKCSLETWSVITSRRIILYPRFKYIGSTSVRQDTSPITWIGASCSKKSRTFEPRPCPWNTNDCKNDYYFA